MDAGDRVPLRDPLIRTLRCLGAGVTKSCELPRASESTSSLLERCDPSLLNLALLLRPGPMRTTRGAGLPLDRSLGDVVRERLS
jgi:hypothetical protein